MNIHKFLILIVFIIFLAEIISANAANISDGSLVAASSLVVPSAPGVAVSPSSDIASAIALTDYKFKDWGEYESVSMKGEKYFSRYVESANESRDLFLSESTGQNSLNGKYLEKVLVDDDSVMNLTSGTTLKLQEGYELAIKSIDIDGNKIYLELTKNGSVVDSKVISPSKDDATVADKTYYYENSVSGGEQKIVTLAIHFKSVISQSGQNMATIDGVWQISDLPVQYKPSSTENAAIPYKSANYAINGKMETASEYPAASEEMDPGNEAKTEAEAALEEEAATKPAEIVAETAAKPEAEAALEEEAATKPVEAVAETAAKPEAEAAPEERPAEAAAVTEASVSSAGNASNGRKPIGLGQIADDIPDKMYAKKLYTITAYITEDIKENITGQPVWERTPAIAKAKVGDNMSVTLSGGDNFIITPLSEKVQSLAFEGNATWQWHVEALVAGEQTLSLSADIILSNGEVHHYRTYEHTVNYPPMNWRA